ncbi:MAG: toll/interleukin-1 receptor domain-containing protein [Chloroflexi bacterium]|nr:toll/interleukin-1 receptor domain-containing protein [Chloroflexota bacterium]
MANPEHLAKLDEALEVKDISIWNRWRNENQDRQIDLSKIALTKPKLDGVDFSRVDLRDATFIDADLVGANLSHARLFGARLLASNLGRANLTEAHLGGAELSESILSEADLVRADLFRTNLTLTNLWHSNFAEAKLSLTIFASVDLSTVYNLGTVRHRFQSYIDIFTLYKSNGNIPEVFLRGCGVPETMITFAKSLVGKPIQYYSAFISNSPADEHFARRLHNDLQMNGVRVWFAPEDLKIGETIEDSIDQAIRVYDKLILVLSQNSIDRAWVRKEFSKAIEKEKQHGKTVLFPIRLDDTVFETTERWAYDIRKRHIGDFTKWENPLLYQAAINRLLRDLNAGT